MTVSARDKAAALFADDTPFGAPPIDVMHVITSLDVGGAESQLARLAAGDAAGAVSHSVVSLKPGGALRTRLEADGIPVRDLGIERNSDAPGGLLRLAAAIRDARPAVVHSWLYHADLLATLALALSGQRRATRLIWGVRCSDRDMSCYALGSRLVLRLLPRLSRRTNLVLCNAEAGRAAHQRLGYRPARWRVVPNGVDLERFRPRPGERAAVRAGLGLNDAHFVVGMCARVDPVKDHAAFVKAAAAFAGTAPEARFVLIGAGTNEPGSPLHRAVARSGIGNRFVRLGLRRDVDRLHAALDVATLSSVSEGFPNVLAEAMACGVPCAATDVGDSAAIVGNTGFVVPPGDPEALAAAWTRLRSEGRDVLAARGAEARRRIAERYSLAAMIDAYRTLYGELAMSGGARAEV